MLCVCGNDEGLVGAMAPCDAGIGRISMLRRVGVQKPIPPEPSILNRRLGGIPAKFTISPNMISNTVSIKGDCK